MGPGGCTDKRVNFVVKAGEKEHNASGMVRSSSAGKTDYMTILNGPMFDRWAEHLTKALEHYPDMEDGTANWMQANSEAELRRYRKSALRHLRQWLRGDMDEDHAAAVFFNINGAEYLKAKLSVNVPAPAPATVAFVEPKPVYDWPDSRGIWQYQSVHSGQWTTERYLVEEEYKDNNGRYVLKRIHPSGFTKWVVHRDATDPAGVSFFGRAKNWRRVDVVGESISEYLERIAASKAA